MGSKLHPKGVHLQGECHRRIGENSCSPPYLTHPDKPRNDNHNTVCTTARRDFSTVLSTALTGIQQNKIPLLSLMYFVCGRSASECRAARHVYEAHRTRVCSCPAAEPWRMQKIGLPASAELKGTVRIAKRFQHKPFCDMSSAQDCLWVQLARQA